MSENKKLLVDPLSTNNPITVQVLGVCSALAVTSTVANSLVMGLAVIFVTALSNLTISLIRNLIPGRIRMIVQLVVIAFLVTLVSISLKAFAYDLSKELSVFVGLIITNCIVMGRLEAFAMANKPVPALLDGIGNGLGYAVILLIVGFIREVFGAGTLSLPFVSQKWEFAKQLGLYDMGYQNNGLMVLPIASIFLIGLLVWIHRARNTELVDIS
jgi:Na+-transporting NADH:ubiquinone oxidoreductase subunit D